MTTTTRSATSAAPARTKSPLFTALIGLCALTILLQGLWAGIFLEHDGQRDAASTWIEVHAVGSWIALALAALATIVGFLQLRTRRDLWIGSAVLTLLLVIQGFIGGQIRDAHQDALTAVHVPLAMALMATVVWLSVRATLGSRSGSR